MSAGTLRKAAELMRERAEAATPAPWVVDVLEEGEVDVRARRGAGPTVATTIPLGYELRRSNAAHIASWHPAVALAVADWLDDTAAWFEADDLYGPAEIECALAVARAYLGESA